MLFDAEALNPIKSHWQPPESFPDLSHAKVICIDIETCDPDLRTKGPGTRRGGYIVGVAVGTDDGYRAYFPIAHQIGGNLDRTTVLRWLNEELSRPHQPKIGANILYDLEYLALAGVNVAGPIYDIQYAEPLLDEGRKSYSLQALAQSYLGESKRNDEMYRWAWQTYGGRLEEQGGNIWRCPARLVGPYAEGDVDLPLRIFEQQKQRLHQQGLWDLFLLECSLIPLLLAMRLRGVRVDVPRAERLLVEVERRMHEAHRRLNDLAGFEVNVHASDSLVRLFRALGIPFPLTDRGNPSFTKQWLATVDHLSARLILIVRKFETMANTFLRGYILEGNIDGRLYGQFHPLRSDAGGTVSGRFSSSNPNLQNIPARDKTMIELDGQEMRLGAAVRSLFIPEEGCRWYKDDYSQVEFRILTHYGTGPHAEAAQDAYRKDKTTDFHDLVAQMCGIERSAAKNINFGLAYSMGEQTLADSLGLPLDAARRLFQQYHERLPFIRDLQQATTNVAQSRGWIRTILGRRARFMAWEPRSWKEKERSTLQPLPREQAIEKWGRAIQRAGTHKALNRLIQGSAADIMKAAMSKIWQAGICDVTGAPHLTIHDELDWSVSDDPKHQEAHREALHIMETAVPLRVPLVCDSESGPTWGEVG